MRATISKKALVTLIGRVKGAASTEKGAIPTLASVLLTAEAAALGGTLRASATDLYRAASAAEPADVHTAGSVALPAKDLEERVRALPDGPVEVSTDESHRATVRATGAKRRFEIAGLPGDALPAQPVAEPGAPALAIGAEALETLIARTIFGVSSDVTRAHLNAVRFSWRSGAARMVSTDGHRLSVADVSADIDASSDGSVLIALSALTELRRSVESATEPRIRIQLGSTWIIASIGPVSFGFKRLAPDVVFPPYERVIPERAATRARVSRAQLIETIRAVAVSSRDGSVKMTIGSGHVRFVAESAESGRGEDEIAATVEGSGHYTGATNAKYLSAPLESLECDEVSIEVSESLDPIMIRPIDGGTYTAVVMPVRL